MHRSRTRNLVGVAGILLLVSGSVSSTTAQRPDHSSEKDSVFLSPARFRLAGGATLGSGALHPELGTVIRIAPQRYPNASPSMELLVPAVQQGYYSVSAYGYPTRTLWHPDEFIEFQCEFAGDGYRMKTGAQGTETGSVETWADQPGRYQELCRFYFIVKQPGDYTLRLRVNYAPVPIFLNTVELRQVDRHLPKSLLKKHSTLITPQLRARFEENHRLFNAQFPGAPAPVEILRASDADLWNHVPDWRILRVVWHNFDCPVHGMAIRKQHSIYPWQLSGILFDGRAGVTCPIGGETYPTNDYWKGDLSSGEYPDDGMGYYDIDHKTGAAKDYQLDKKESQHGPHFFFLGVWAQVALRQAADLAHRAAISYYRTGNPEYAHKGAVLLARCAYLYPCMDWAWQSTEGNMWYRYDSIHGRQGRFNEFHVESIILSDLLQAYDLLFDYLKHDKEVAALAHGHLPWVNSPDDLLLLVDRNILRLGAETAEQQFSAEDYAHAWFALGLVGDNRNWFERELQTYAVQGGSSPLIYFPTNLLNRDGNGVEALVPYDQNSVVLPMTDIASWIERMADPRLTAAYDVWRGEPFAKWRALLETWPKYFVAGDGLPNLGDGYTTALGVRAHATLDPWPALRLTYALAYANLRDPAFAYYAGGTGGRQYLPFAAPETLARMEDDARTYRPAPNRSRNLTGTGLVILESRPNGSLITRSGVSCRYGVQILEHQHKEVLTAEYFAKGIDLTPDFGWPPNTGTTDRHNTLMVDDEWSVPGGGYLRALHSGESLQFAQITGINLLDSGPAAEFERSLALVDVGDRDTYLLDLFRAVAGKQKHTYLWHSTQGGLSLNVSTQPTNLYNWDNASSTALGATAPLEATWTIDNKPWSVMTRDPDIKKFLDTTTLYLREHLLAAPRREVWIAKMPRADFPNSWTAAAVDLGTVQKTPKQSTFLAVLEPFATAPFIRQIEDLFPGANGTALPRGARVISAIPGSGKLEEDIHLFAEGEATAAGVTLVGGSYGFYRTIEGAPTQWTLVGSFPRSNSSSPQMATLSTPTLTISLQQNAYTGKVVTVDWKHGNVVVMGRIPLSAKGQSLTFRTPAGRITNYNVTAVDYDAGRNETHLVLEHFFPLFVGDVQKIDKAQGLLQTGQQPRMGSQGVYHFAKGRFLDGTYLVNEARTQQAALGRYGPVDDKPELWFRLVDPKDLAKLSDAPGANYGPLGEKEHLVFVYDVGVGDSVIFVPSVSITIKDDGSYILAGSGSVLTRSAQGRIKSFNL